MCPDNTAARMDASPSSLDSALRHNGMGGLIGAIGTRDFELELVRHLMQMFHSEFVHISHFPAGQPEMLLSVAEDGGNRAREQSAAYLERRLWQFDPTIDAGSRWDAAAPLLSRLDVDRPETRELKIFYDEKDIREPCAGHWVSSRNPCFIEPRQRGAACLPPSEGTCPHRRGRSPGPCLTYQREALRIVPSMRDRRRAAARTG